MDFEWDENKARMNEAKHGVAFDAAATVFDDPYARLIPDPDHSAEEDRFILLGLTHDAEALVVCHCLRGMGLVIRIISARKATRKEENEYWRFRNEG